MSVKDLWATIVTVVSGYITYAQWKNMDLGFLSSPRWSVVALFVLGVMACALGSNPDVMTSKSSWTTLAAIGVGAVALAGLIGLITGNKSWVVVMGSLLVTMWLATTAKHILAK